MAPVSSDTEESAELKREEKEFEDFFAKLQPIELQYAIKDIQRVLEVENGIPLIEMPTQNGENNPPSKDRKIETSGNGALSKGKKINSRVKRSSQSQAQDTMSRLRSSGHNSYYDNQYAQSRASMCRRRCYWMRMFYLCRYGRHMTQTCYC